MINNLSGYFAYFIFVALFVATSLLSRKLIIFQSFLVFILLSLIIGGSVQNGADWIWYSTDYDLVVNSSSFLDALSKSNFESGFIALMYMCGLTGVGFQCLVLLCGILNSATWVYFSKKTLPQGNVAITSLFLFLIDGWVLYNEQIRQALAVSLSMLAFVAWEKGSRLFSYFWLSVAILFHRSSIVFVLLLFLYDFIVHKPNRWHSKTVLLMTVGGVALTVIAPMLFITSDIFSIFQENIIYQKLVIYSRDDNYGSSVFSLGMFSYLFGLLVVILGYKHVLLSENSFVRFCWFIVLFWCFSGPLLRIQSIFLRFEHYLLLFVPLLLGYLWSSKSQRGKVTTLRLVLIVFAVSFSGRVFLQPTQSVWVNSYQNYFLNNLFFLELQNSDLRFNELCQNLRSHENYFCDWR